MLLLVSFCTVLLRTCTCARTDVQTPGHPESLVFRLKMLVFAIANHTALHLWPWIGCGHVLGLGLGLLLVPFKYQCQSNSIQ
jgi:hypothetical protein